VRESRTLVAAKLAEVFEARRRLARLRSDYVVIERSKFARLRSLWLIFKSLFGFGTKNDRFAAISGPITLSVIAPEPPIVIDTFEPSRKYAAVADAFRARAAKQKSSLVPIASVVIPAFNQCSVTMRCLKSIADTWFDTMKVEIIVVDDCSSDDTASTLATIPGITVIRNSVNQGFIRSCNRGAAIATGRYLCFLNNDTEVRNGWLDYLVSTADADPTVGAVGAKLIYPDGRLQEAGNIIWRDASGWNYGRFDDPADPMYNFIREVDYCSGACLLVRADLFRAVGGFNVDLVPAYYEDADLCFALRELGYRTLCDPRSEVVHYEGLSSGTDIGGGAKRFQEVNRPKFERRWQHMLTSHYDNDPANVYKAARRLGSSRRTILVVDSYVPFHDREAGSARLFEIVKVLRGANWRVVFQPDNWAGIEPYTHDLQSLGVEVVYHVEGQRGQEQRLNELLPHVDIAWVCRPEICDKWLPVFRRYPQIRVIYDTVDLHHVRLRRQAEIEGTPESQSWKAIEALELACGQKSDATVTVTVEEKATLEAAGIRPVYVVPTIHNPRVKTPRNYAQTDGLLFIGGYGHLPNVDAVQWLCTEIMPIVRREIGEMRVTLLGNNPPPLVVGLRSATVDVPGFIPDVEPYFLSHRIFVAPLRYGAGMKGKIGHSLSYGLPTISTSIGAEGFGLRDGEDFLRADDAAEFAAAILRVYSDAALWMRLSENALSALRPFTSEAISEKLQQILDDVLATEVASAGARVS
jgi:GT2 family glycosyltransferase/glycosyltransferase involved in cell wall biosynthesis